MEFRINGRRASFTGDPDMPLLWRLRDGEGLTWTTYGCGIGAAGPAPS